MSQFITRYIVKLVSSAGFLLGAFLLWFGTFGMHWMLLTILAAVTGLLQVIYLIGNASLRRKLFFETYLAPDSYLQKYKEMGILAKLFLPISSIALSLVTVVSVFSFGSAHTIAALVGIAVGFVVATAVQMLWLKHIHQTFRSYLDSKAVTSTAVIAGAIALFFWEIYDTRSDFAQLSSTHAADTVIREIHHPVKWVQDLARTNRFAGLTMLRMRDNLGNAAGNLIFAYLIIPNLLPIFGMVILIKGTMGIVTQRFKKTYE